MSYDDFIWWGLVASLLIISTTTFLWVHLFRGKDSIVELDVPNEKLLGYTKSFKNIISWDLYCNKFGTMLCGLNMSRIVFFIIIIWMCVSIYSSNIFGFFFLKKKTDLRSCLGFMPRSKIKNTFWSISNCTDLISFVTFK